ncbi:MAG: sigma-70 family RNA polymerase sigma factor [Planctomycetes bacterium]|nr:sigma-70 family RNA polymerase sigma factor [Planctomycetota bacterium]
MQTSTETLLSLLDRQGPSLHALLTRLTLREDVAEDLMQDLFIKLSGSKRLDQVDNLAAYARTCAMNLAFDWRRREKRLATCSDDLIDAVADGKSVLSHLVENEQFKAVLDATENLSKLQRQVFVLRYIEQRSFEQIARETDKTPHHVRALASRSLARVREICSKVRVKPHGGGQS